jgi:hypothetical protein
MMQFFEWREASCAWLKGVWKFETYHGFEHYLPGSFCFVRIRREQANSHEMILYAGFPTQGFNVLQKARF